MNDLDWQIEKCEGEATRAMRSVPHWRHHELTARDLRHRAGEWTAIQNSLIELRNRRAVDPG